ncbi:MAG: hypothetical protein PUC11_01500, partial [Elusimicrobia bacterium]|nr:hypothetical protein [Elusimicrobiota bacterium]
ILASVALPQYQKAVQKTRTMRLISLLRSISEAENVYYMANGTYTTQFEDLDIGMPSGGRVESSGSRIIYGDFYCYLRHEGDNPDSFSAYCNDNREEAPTLERYFARDYFICWANHGEGSLDWRVCQNISGKNQPNYFNGVARASFVF